MSSSYDLGAPTGGLTTDNDPNSTSSTSAYSNLPPVTSYTTIINGQPQVQAVTNTTDGVAFDQAQAAVQPQSSSQGIAQAPFQGVQPSNSTTNEPTPVTYNPVQVPIVASQTIIEQPQPISSSPTSMAPPTTSSSVRFDPSSPPQSQQPQSSTTNLQIAETRRDRSSSTATARSSTYSVATTTGTDTTDGPGGSDDCVKEKRVKEWNKHFDVEGDEAVVCSESWLGRRLVMTLFPNCWDLGM